MEDIIARYTTALDELNRLMTTSYYTADGEDVTARTKQVADDLLSFLVNAYRLGIQNASAMLETELTMDLDLMEAAIFLRIDGKTFEDRVADHIGEDNEGRLKTLAESEFHRVYNTAVDDGAKECAARGNRVTKTWCTMLDDRVRDTHDYLEGMTVAVGEDFYTFDGDHAAYPGGFLKAENNAGCRCIVLLNQNVLRGPSPLDIGGRETA